MKKKTKPEKVLRDWVTELRILDVRLSRLGNHLKTNQLLATKDAPAGELEFCRGALRWA